MAGIATVGLERGPATPTLGDTKADERALERGPRALLVGRRRRSRLELPLGTVASLLRALHVDVLDVLRRVGEDHHAVAADVHEAPEDREHLFDPAALHAELA